jgi:hypothetical protein
MEDVDLVLVLPTPMRLVELGSKVHFLPVRLLQKRNKLHKLHLPRGSKALLRRHSSLLLAKVMMVASLDVVDSTLGDALALLLL